MTKRTSLAILSLGFALCFATTNSMAAPVFQEATTEAGPDYDLKLRQSVQKYADAKSQDEKYGTLKLIATIMHEDIRVSREAGGSEATLKNKEQIAEKFVNGIQEKTLDDKKLSGLIQEFIKL